MTKFNLSEKRERMFKAVIILASKEHKDTISVIKINIEDQDKEFIKRAKKINKLKFPLGCDIKMRDATTTCGDISFGNKIILCDNCTHKLINKFEENEKEFDKLAGDKLNGI